MSQLSNGRLSGGPKPQSEKTLQRIKTVTVNWYDEAGTTMARKSVPLYLSKLKDMQFVIRVPDYVQRVLDSAPEVRAATATLVIKEFDSLQYEYHQKMKQGAARPVLVITVDTNPDRWSHDTIDKQSKLDLKYKRAFAIGDEIYQIEEYEVDITKEEFDKSNPTHREFWGKYTEKRFRPGRKNPFSRSSHSVVMGYSLELHAGLDRIMAMIEAAAQQLAEIVKNKDMAKLLGTPLQLAAPKPAAKRIAKRLP